MKLRNAKDKATPEPIDRRRRPVSSVSSPAFSYYANRTPTSTRTTRTQPSNNDRQETKSPERPAQVRRSGLNIVPFWLLVTVVIICVVKVLFLTTDPKIVIVGKSSTTADYVQSTAIYETAARKLLNSSITNHAKFTADFSGVSQQMRAEFPELQDVSMSAPLIGNRPIVYVQVATPSLVLQSSVGNFALSSNGIVLARLRAIPAGIPLVADQSDTPPYVGKQYLPSSAVQFTRTVTFQLGAAHMTINTFVLPPSSPYELDIRMAGQAYYIRCNLEGDALTQSGAIVATLQHLGSTTPATYLDVRVPGRVYYK